MNYILLPTNGKLTSTEIAKSISRELFRISRPASNEEDVSTYLFGWVTHPITGESALECDILTSIPVHPDADVANLIAIINPEESQKEEADSLENFIENSKGFSIQFNDIIPSWIEVVTREFMENAGWFSEDY